MRSLYEKLNGLDDSLVESKRVVKKKKLTESFDDNMFKQLKNWMSTNNVTEEEFYWSDYHDVVNYIYGSAIEEITSQYNVEFDFSTQAGQGGCWVRSSDEDGEGECYWDYEEDRESVFEMVKEANSSDELKGMIITYLKGKISDMTWSEYDDDYDDDIYEMLTEDVRMTKTMQEDILKVINNNIEYIPLKNIITKKEEQLQTYPRYKGKKRWFGKTYFRFCLVPDYETIDERVYELDSDFERKIATTISQELSELFDTEVEAHWYWMPDGSPMYPRYKPLIEIHFKEYV